MSKQPDLTGGQAKTSVKVCRRYIEYNPKIVDPVLTVASERPLLVLILPAPLTSTHPILTRVMVAEVAIGYSCFNIPTLHQVSVIYTS